MLSIKHVYSALAVAIVLSGETIVVASAEANTPNKDTKARVVKKPSKLAGLETYQKMAETFGDQRIPRLKRVEQFEKMVSEIVEKTNELSTHLNPEEIDHVLPLFELKALVSEIPMQKVRDRKCNVALNQILVTAGPSVQGPNDLNPIGRFVYDTLGKICN